MEVIGCLTLAGALFTRPGFADRVLEVAPPPGPSREELLRLID